MCPLLLSTNKVDEMIMQLITKLAWCGRKSTVSLDQYSLCSHSEWSQLLEGLTLHYSGHRVSELDLIGHCHLSQHL